MCHSISSPVIYTIVDTHRDNVKSLESPANFTPLERRILLHTHDKCTCMCAENYCAPPPGRPPVIQSSQRIQRRRRGARCPKARRAFQRVMMKLRIGLEPFAGSIHAFLSNLRFSAPLNNCQTDAHRRLLPETRFQRDAWILIQSLFVSWIARGCEGVSIGIQLENVDLHASISRERSFKWRLLIRGINSRLYYYYVIFSECVLYCHTLSWGSKNE